MTVGPTSPGVAGAKERGQNGIERSSSTDSEKTSENEVRTGLDDETVRREVLQLLEELQNMWSGCLGKIGAAKHRIALTPGVRPIYRAPYRTGQRLREFEEA